MNSLIAAAVLMSFSAADAATIQDDMFITGKVVLTNILTLPSVTVAGLPTCNAYQINSVMVVSDATSPTYNGTLTGGGAVKIIALCNGTAWTAH